MHAADDGVYHVQLRGTIPTCTFIIQRNVSLEHAASGSAGSVRVIDGQLFIFAILFVIVLSAQSFTVTVYFIVENSLTYSNEYDYYYH